MSGIHFDPITLGVRDFDRCLTFYRDVFEPAVIRLHRGCSNARRGTDPS
jgi:catechol 2,3-dioxygenase-like lactoylglutathione lyase family enzyme